MPVTYTAGKGTDGNRNGAGTGLEATEGELYNINV